jgi:hypothetical protein
MQIDWFLVGLVVVTLPLAAWGYWIVTNDADPRKERGEGEVAE